MSRSGPPAALLVVLAALGIGIGWWFLNRYSVPRQDQSYLPAARELLTAALAADSSRIAASSDNPEVVSWALATAQVRPQLLRALLNGLAESASRLAAENTLVLFTSKGCGSGPSFPLAVTFRGPPSSPRIVAVSTSCEPRR